MQWIMENKEWLFSGAGIVIFSFIVNYFIQKTENNKQTQKSKL